MPLPRPLFALLGLLLVLPLRAAPPRYDIGSPTLQDVYVDPVRGNDGAAGTSREPLRSLQAAWNRVPRGQTLTGTGYRIRLAPGVYSPDLVPNFFEERYGTREFPILIETTGAPGDTRLPALNFFDCRYVYLIGLEIAAGGGDALHFEKGDHILLRSVTVIGTGDIATFQAPQETLKINQSQYVYVEDSDISGASDNAIDFVGVQYGHLVNNRIHRALDWCLYLKGGSAYLRVEGNEVFDCGTGGFTAGQGTGFQFMTSPWIHYEAYDLKFTNNVVHDVAGAGFGVNGGYDILFAHNTVFRSGGRGHLFEAVFGNRSCDGQPGGDPVRENCQTFLAQGGWGTTVVDDGTNSVRIPNRNVLVFNNVFENPQGAPANQLLAVSGPFTNPASSNVPAPARADEGLFFAGNVFHLAGRELPSGLGDDTGCTAGNATCTEALFQSGNAVNTGVPALRDGSAGDFRPITGAAAFTSLARVPPAFTGTDRPTMPSSPQGDLVNLVPEDRDGVARTSPGPAGAYAKGVDLPPAPDPVTVATRFVPVLVSASGAGGAYFSTELILANRGTKDGSARLAYTDTTGARGEVVESLPAGRQKVIPDAIAFLREHGVTLPEGNRVGTLRVVFEGLASPFEGAVLARTTTPVPGGRAGLSYAGLPIGQLFSDAAVVAGLRQNERDRSNLALAHGGAPGSGGVVLDVTVFDETAPAGRSLSQVSLAEGGFVQLNAVLAVEGRASNSGWIRVSRASGSAPWFSYGVVNDQANGDGSFLPGTRPETDIARSGFVVPVAVETAAFQTELVVTNVGVNRQNALLSYAASALGNSEKVSPLTLSLGPGEQVVLPEVVEHLRAAGAPGVGPRGPGFAGALFVKAAPGTASGLRIGARTSTPGGGGRYGLFYAALPDPGLAAERTAYLFGLRQDAIDRTNLAIVNTGSFSGDESTFEIALYDGATGALAATVRDVRVPARGFVQLNAVLAAHAPGVTNAYARVSRTSGSNPFLTYAVINDGAEPGQRSGDGTFVAMELDPLEP